MKERARALCLRFFNAASATTPLHLSDPSDCTSNQDAPYNSQTNLVRFARYTGLNVTAFSSYLELGMSNMDDVLLNEKTVESIADLRASLQHRSLSNGHCNGMRFRSAECQEWLRIEMSSIFFKRAGNGTNEWSQQRSTLQRPR
jgi:hypothetical protein